MTTDVPMTSAEKRQRRKQRRGKVGALFIKLFGQLPLRVNRSIGSCIGRSIWWTKGETTQIAIDNIARCFPEKDKRAVKQLAKRSVIESAKTAMEAASIWRQPYQRYQSTIVKVEGENLLTEEAPNGILLLVPHLGNWEVMGPYVAEHIDSIYMYQPSGIDAIDEITIEGRTRNGAKLAPANRKGVKMLLGQLKRGDLVTILPDQVPDESGGDIVPFFGVPALTMTLVHKLVMRTGCRVVIGFSKRIDDGFHFYFSAVDSAISNADTHTSLTTMNKEIETMVSKAPEQYQWEYKRFKHAGG